jgi:hypothetical protein
MWVDLQKILRRLSTTDLTVADSPVLCVVVILTMAMPKQLLALSTTTCLLVWFVRHVSTNPQLKMLNRKDDLLLMSIQRAISLHFCSLVNSFGDDMLFYTHQLASLRCKRLDYR